MAEPSQQILPPETGTKEPTPIQLPAVLGSYKIAKVAPEQLKELVDANVAGGISAFDLDRIKVPSGGGVQWCVPSLAGDQYVKEVEGVIVAWSDQRSYWANAFSGAGSPPDCSSKDSLTGQGDPGGNCSRCRMAAFGSALKDGAKQAGQACKQVRLLFLIRAEDMLPIVVSVPPTSLKAVRSYFLRLASQGTPYYGVITRFKLAEDKNAGGIKYSKVEPAMAKLLNDSEAARIKGYSDSIRGTLHTIDAAPGDYEAAHT